uniref:RING-type domain-containing protein n=1 Tax=Neogobius melanostomus TaxID=47308 RepID=A0A8C6TL93_9GOBI
NLPIMSSCFSVSLSQVRMAAVRSEDQFLCSICLDLFTEPVSTPCGHNFCRRCLSQHWDTSAPCRLSCDHCSAPKLKALKSCLVCLSSYCESHLQPHLSVPGLKSHQLMEPVDNMEDRMCPQHHKPLELFCRSDHSCLCTMSYTDPHTPLSLKRAPQKVGVFVDYDEGLVSFYDADTADLIYSFTNCSFREKLFPLLNPCGNAGGENSAPLILTAVKK